MVSREMMLQPWMDAVESTSLSTKMFGVAVLCIAVAALTTGLGLQQKSVRKRRMSRLGRSTLVTEIESNLSIAVMVSMLDKPLKTEEWIARLRERMSAGKMFERYRSMTDGVNFIEMDDFDPAEHVHKVTLQDGETPYDYAEKVTNTPLDMDKPLWRCDVIESFDKKAFFIWRIHHCIGDGMSLVTSFIHMSDDTDKYEQLVHVAEENKKMKDVQPTTAAKAKSSRSSLATILNLTALFWWSMWVIFRKISLLVIRKEPQTVFKKPGGKNKHLRCTTALSVNEVKSVGREFGATVNDVMLECITGGLRSIIVKHDKNLLRPTTSVRAAIPIDMRPSGARIKSTSNKFSSLLVELPVGMEGSVRRLRRIKSNMKEAKTSLEKYFLYLCSQLLGYFPGWFVRPFLRFMTSEVTIAISNIRGTPMTLNFCGRKAISMTGYVPPPPLVNAGIAIFSVGDELGFSLLVDDNALSNPDELVEAILLEFKSLQNEVKNNSKNK